MHTTTTDKWFAIVNPVAGNGKCGKRWNEIKSILDEYELKHDFRLTTKPKDAETIVCRALEEGHRKIISVGGDGNIHDIANGILAQKKVPSKDVTMGVIPVGTGNDLVKNYGIPNNFRKAVELLLQPATALHDAGKASFFEGGAKKERYFINFCGVGFDAFVVERVTAWKPYGKIAYLLGTLRWMFPYKKPKLRITTAEKVLETDCYMALAGIGKFSGGGMQLTPLAKTDDGLFSLMTAKNLSKLELIFRLKILYDGSIARHREVETWETSQIKIEAIHSGFEVKMQADGDLLGSGPFEIISVPGALRIVVGKVFTD